MYSRWKSTAEAEDGTKVEVIITYHKGCCLKKEKRMEEVEGITRAICDKHFGVRWHSLEGSESEETEDVG